MFFVLALALPGLLLIFLEFFLPGAIMAISGSLLLLGSLLLFSATYEGIGSLFLYSLALAASVFFVIRFAISRVKATGKQGTVYLAVDQEGFQASLFPKEMIGKAGIAGTDLKPSGHIWIEDRSYQALSRGEYIDKGTPIQILGGQGSHLIVTASSKVSS